MSTSVLDILDEEDSTNKNGSQNVISLVSSDEEQPDVVYQATLSVSSPYPQEYSFWRTKCNGLSFI